MMYCPKCGRENLDAAVICLHCHAPLNPEKVIDDDPLARSRLIAGLVAITFGAVGIHNFYLAHYVKGSIQMILFVIVLFLLHPYGPIAMFVWGLVEGILILLKIINKDGSGRYMK
ncbi:MAG: TM2 domain-containing protein [Acholeplasmataceae bacterium]|nr:MAG: TM2 domain-containing protein [Acholeplasmataceae bacterium]